jgi:GWxTD domain-containing protein
MKKVIITCMLLVLIAGCGSGNMKLDTEPVDDSFYDMTRFIMTKAEKEIYRHLPDSEAREEFIEEFWLKRDPSPDTGDNENKFEYEKRIEFANKWFKEKPTGRGWDSDRGRILLMLGFPDERNTHVTTHPGTTWQVSYEIWRYYGHELILRFIDEKGFGQYNMEYWPARLRTALEKAALTMDLRNAEALENAFAFDVAFKNRHIVITIPVKRIQFEERDGKMSAPFLLEIFIYHNYKKLERIEKEETVIGSKGEILERKDVEIKVPYELSGKGKYFFDVITKDVMTGSRYRNVCSFKK